ncbi:hypothetical protein LZ30DRAFT_196059 [Colletotrichum cereale]|nr:hypothetical protein LZ30DRAFT_196059 [Colletotrichum cereale]
MSPWPNTISKAQTQLFWAGYARPPDRARGMFSSPGEASRWVSFIHAPRYLTLPDTSTDAMLLVLETGNHRMTAAYGTSQLSDHCPKNRVVQVCQRITPRPKAFHIPPQKLRKQDIIKLIGRAALSHRGPRPSTLIRFPRTACGGQLPAPPHLWPAFDMRLIWITTQQPTKQRSLNKLIDPHGRPNPHTAALQTQSLPHGNPGASASLCSLSCRLHAPEIFSVLLPCYVALTGLVLLHDDHIWRLTDTGIMLSPRFSALFGQGRSPSMGNTSSASLAMAPSRCIEPWTREQRSL